MQTLHKPSLDTMSFILSNQIPGEAGAPMTYENTHILKQWTEELPGEMS